MLGFDTAQQYAESGPYMGCIAGRYANRIAKGLFTIDGNPIRPDPQQRPQHPSRRVQGIGQADVEF